MADSQTKLKNLLRELFQLDSADLDFGIYRIMNTKRSEIERFLDNDLLPQIKKAFLQYKSSDSAQIKVDLDKVIQQLKDAGVDPDLSPKVKELRDKLSTAIDISALESQIFSDLFNFFRRYYNEGDFLSLRRYKEGVYAVPYEGEEVKLYWANHDQYYIKSSEYLRDYAFKLADGRRVHFRLAAADVEKDNNKSASGNDRRFILAGDGAIAEDNGELIIRFDYRSDAEKRRQDALNMQTERAILEAPATAAWLFVLAALAPSEADPNRTVLAKHLKDYTARNTFDYFIHKDVGPFLRRELDFFIKNEVMHLDDIENTTGAQVQQYLSRIRILRTIGHKIIEFVTQLENFQKRLWLKKKFVVETHYCITLDRVPRTLYAAIASSDVQRQEWIRLFAIDRIAGDLVRPGYTCPLSLQFLEANPFLIVDTSLFDSDFKEELLRNMSDLDSEIDGVLVHSENFQGLQLIIGRYQGSIDCAYLDPPYNTGADHFPYKDAYQHSSWLAMMRDRLSLVRRLLSKDGALFISCDDNEQANLVQLVGELIGTENVITTMVWEGGRKNDAKQVSVSHEYVIAAARSVRQLKSDNKKWRQRKEGVDAIYKQATRLKKKCGSDYTTASEEMKAWYAALPDNNPAKRHKRYFWIDARTEERGPYFADKIAGPDDGRLSRPRDIVLHPKTGKPVQMPSTGWCWSDIHQKVRDELVHFGVDETTVPNKKTYLKDTEFEAPHSVFYKDGRAATLLLEAMIPGTEFDNPKDVDVISKLISVTTGQGSTILDCFSGSGTTAHAVIELTRATGLKRQYVLIDMGDHFKTVSKARIQKAIYSKQWKNGIPTDREGRSHCFKYLRLESYEDTLNNLELKRNAAQGLLLDNNQTVREDYTLRYALDVESRGSPSLLRLDGFIDPFGYTLEIAAGTVGETMRTPVDLVETFNYLLGLRVKHLDTIRGFRVVHGANQDGEKVLVIWRNVEENPNPKLDDFFQKQRYNTKDMEFDLIYVNGDNNLENLKKDEDSWKVRLIEEEFARLMFDVQDV